MKHKFALAFIGSFPLAAGCITANAQTHTLPAKSLEQVLAAGQEDSTAFIETLSGIHLKPVKKGSFQLDFSQALKENAILAITNTAGKMVFQQPVKATKRQKLWSYNLGKLKPDTYLVEVKTSDTTYWTRFKVGK